jgi:N6-adenosine-specific RNA methylase IME4
MTRDRLTKEQAVSIVNRLAPSELTRLELEARDHRRPAFTSDYDPFAR